MEMDRPLFLRKGEFFERGCCTSRSTIITVVLASKMSRQQLHLHEDNSNGTSRSAFGLTFKFQKVTDNISSNHVKVHMLETFSIYMQSTTAWETCIAIDQRGKMEIRMEIPT